MNSLLYWIGRLLVGAIQALPVSGAARLGQAFGWIGFHLDRKHRRVALENIDRVYGSKLSTESKLDLVRTHFLRLGENYVCAVNTASRSADELRQIVEFSGLDNIPIDPATGKRRNMVVAIGHFGNFELYGRVGLFLPGIETATTFRGIKPAGLDRLLRELREKTGCHYFERRSEGAALREFMARPATILGLLVDQHGGDNGLRLPFLGHEASTNPSAAVFALRYGAALSTAICYRTAPGRWRIELGTVIPTRNPDGTSRAIPEITLDLNRVLEAAVLRDPANWFWVHRRWKTARPRHRRAQEAEPVMPH